MRNKTCGRAAPCSGRVQDAAREVDGMNLRYFERRTEVVRAYVRAENGCEETNHFVKPSAIELARIAEARNGRKKFDVFVKPNGQSRACASYAMARKRLLKTNLFDKPSAEPNLFGLCRGEKTTVENKRILR